MALDDETRVMISERRKAAEGMICPDCGTPLHLVPARTVHPCYSENDLARKCSRTGCAFICTMGDRTDGE